MMTRKISMTIAFLTGLGMIFIGTRFLLAPEIAEAGYGIHFLEQGDYSFHDIKGIRDLFSGLLMCLLVLTNEANKSIEHHAGGGNNDPNRRPAACFKQEL